MEEPFPFFEACSLDFPLDIYSLTSHQLALVSIHPAVDDWSRLVAESEFGKRRSKALERMAEGTPEINAAFELVPPPTAQRFTPQEVTQRFTGPLLETNRGLQADLAAVRRQLSETKQRIRALGGQTSPDRAAVRAQSHPLRHLDQKSRSDAAS